MPVCCKGLDASWANSAPFGLPLASFFTANDKTGWLARFNATPTAGSKAMSNQPLLPSASVVCG
jgi:hypothetical protein